ncbi:MAG: 5-formyltetrahydrofolate cyclo-ligase [Sphingobium sp.]|nr:5-formyltetrahydrofolate cyclo-ligase [Sphingobium sp.]
MTDSTGFHGEDKDKVRRDARAARKAFVAGLDQMAHRLAFHALPSPIRTLIANCQIVALYAPVGDEAPALRLAEALVAEGKTLCLPYVVDRMGTMEFRAWAPGDTLEEGAFGTVQPPRFAPVLHPDAIFAPLVAFDARLMRLGQGGGYYDRAFARYEQALRIGLGWSVQQIDEVPADPWDMPLHRVMTERSIIEPES